MSGVFGTLKEAQENDFIAFSNAQKKYEAINCGLAINDEGEATSLQDQLTSKCTDFLFIIIMINFIFYSCKVENI